MLCAMAAHYRQPPLDHDRALSAARKWLDEESPAYPHFALAFVEGQVSGLASVAIAHPGVDLERLLFLKDLFVRDQVRGVGVGRALIDFLAGHCLSHGIGRIGGSAVEAIARQPEAGGPIGTNMIIAAALIEGAGLFGLVIVLLGYFLGGQ